MSSFWETLMASPPPAATEPAPSPVAPASVPPPSAVADPPQRKKRSSGSFSAVPPPSAAVQPFGTVGYQVSKAKSHAPIPNFSASPGTQSVGRASGSSMRIRPKVNVCIPALEKTLNLSLSSRDTVTSFVAKLLPLIPNLKVSEVQLFAIPPSLQEAPLEQIYETEALTADAIPHHVLESFYGTPLVLNPSVPHFLLHLVDYQDPDRASAASPSSHQIASPLPEPAPVSSPPVAPSHENSPDHSSPSPTAAHSPQVPVSPSPSPLPSSSDELPASPLAPKTLAIETLEALSKSMDQALEKGAQLPTIIAQAKEVISTFRAYHARSVAEGSTEIEQKVFLPIGQIVRALVLAMQSIPTQGAAAMPAVMTQVETLRTVCRQSVETLTAVMKPATPVISEPSPPVVSESPPPVISEPPPPVVSEPPPVISESPPPVVSEPPPIISESPPPVVSEPPPPVIHPVVLEQPASSPQSSPDRDFVESVAHLSSNEPVQDSPMVPESLSIFSSQPNSSNVPPASPSTSSGSSLAECDALRDEVSSLRLQLKKKERELQRAERLLTEYEEELDQIRSTFGLPDKPLQVADVISALLTKHSPSELIQLIHK